MRWRCRVVVQIDALHGSVMWSTAGVGFKTGLSRAIVRGDQGGPVPPVAGHTIEIVTFRPVLDRIRLDNVFERPIYSVGSRTRPRSNQGWQSAPGRFLRRSPADAEDTTCGSVMKR